MKEIERKDYFDFSKIVSQFGGFGASNSSNFSTSIVTKYRHAPK